MISLINADKILKQIYLGIIDDILQGKTLPTAEEKAEEFMNKLYEQEYCNE